MSKPMTVEQLIAELQQFPGTTEITAIVHNQTYPFTMSWGGDGEGALKRDCMPHIYVDELCSNEAQHAAVPSAAPVVTENDCWCNKCRIGRGEKPLLGGSHPCTKGLPRVPAMTLRECMEAEEIPEAVVTLDKWGCAYCNQSAPSSHLIKHRPSCPNFIPVPDAVVSQPEPKCDCSQTGHYASPQFARYHDKRCAFRKFFTFGPETLSATEYMKCLGKRRYTFDEDTWAIYRGTIIELLELYGAYRERLSPSGEQSASPTPVVSQQAEPYRLQYLNKQAYESLLARAAKYEDPRNEDWEWERAGKWERHAINAALEIRALSAPPSLPKAGETEQDVPRISRMEIEEYLVNQKEFFPHAKGTWILEAAIAWGKRPKSATPPLLSAPVWA